MQADKNRHFAKKYPGKSNNPALANIIQNEKYRCEAFPKTFHQNVMGKFV